VWIHREFSHELAGEIILKIGSHLQKLLSNIKWLSTWNNLPSQVDFSSLSRFKRSVKRTKFD